MILRSKQFVARLSVLSQRSPGIFHNLARFLGYHRLFCNKIVSSGPDIIKKVMRFFLLINVKLPPIVGILTVLAF